MDFDQIMAKCRGERYQAQLGLLLNFEDIKFVVCLFRCFKDKDSSSSK